MRLLIFHIVCGLGLGLCFQSDLMGQSAKVCINGSVGTPDEKLSYASVFLLQDGIFLNGTHSDLKGNFVIHDIPPGKYSLVVSWAGIIQLERPEFIIPDAANYILDIELTEIIMPEESEISDASGTQVQEKERQTIALSPSSHQVREWMTRCGGGPVVFHTDSDFSRGRYISESPSPVIVDGFHLVDIGVPPAKAINTVKVLGPDIPAEYDAYYPGTVVVSTR